MKWLPFILRNLKRKKTRTLLTVGSIAVALFLYGLLVTIDTALNMGVDVAGADRLVVRNKVSLIMPLPLSYQQRMRQIDNVTEATHATWFGGVYQEPKNFFAQFAIDTDTYRLVFPEFVMPDDQWQDFLDDREGAVVGRITADRFQLGGWRPNPASGDHLAGHLGVQHPRHLRRQAGGDRHLSVLVPLEVPRRKAVLW